MGLARDFCVESGRPNRAALNWSAPVGFNNTVDELIVTRTITHYPMELFNEDFPTKATDSRPVEIFRGRTIAGTNTANISVVGAVLTDTGASFPTSPNLAGRLLRDANSQVHRILENTATTVTLDDEPADGKYVILPDFPSESRTQENYEVDIRTTADAGSISNLTTIQDGSIILKEFETDEVANMIFRDGNGDKFVIKSNTIDTILFFETDVPVIGPGMAILNSFFESQPIPYIDSFRTQNEADARSGTGLRDNRFYYYTIFNLPIGANVAQAEFATTDSGTPTQDHAISTQDRDFGQILYKYWPSLYQQLDETGDLEDLMEVFGFHFNWLHALIDTYRLQDTETVLVSALLPLSEQTGLPAVGFSIGTDTLRRIARDMISAWRLKGSKEGIAVFIRIITTWDITNGTADYSSAIQDVLPNVSALRFFDANLGSANTRMTESDPLFVAGGRFARGLPGIVIPGFFTFREFVITIPEVALHVGSSESFSVSANTTTMTDSTATFGAVNSLVGNFLLPNQEEVNDIFEIISNTNTTITVRGIITNRNTGGNYAVLSPLNTNRFVILNKLLPIFIPFGTSAGFQFI